MRPSRQMRPRSVSKMQMVGLFMKACARAATPQRIISTLSFSFFASIALYAGFYAMAIYHASQGDIMRDGIHELSLEISEQEMKYLSLQKQLTRDSVAALGLSEASGKIFVTRESTLSFNTR